MKMRGRDSLMNSLNFIVEVVKEQSLACKGCHLVGTKLVLMDNDVDGMDWTYARRDKSPKVKKLLEQNLTHEDWFSFVVRQAHDTLWTLVVSKKHMLQGIRSYFSFILIIDKKNYIY